jgi:aldose 1-epimerase
MMNASDGFEAHKEVFGELEDGTVVHRYTLANDHGMRVRILTYGAIVQTVEVPDRHGQQANVALGFATLNQYANSNTAYFGAVIGRYANRIARGTFTLDGRTYHLPINDALWACGCGTPVQPERWAIRAHW